MNDNWDFYFCQVDGELASIFVDLGLAHDAPISRLSHVGSVRIHMRNPRKDGLSSADEAADLKKLEQALESQVNSSAPAGVLVGRSTSGGNRDLFFYVPSAEAWGARVEAVMKRFPDYRVEADSWEDRAWEAYFGFLFPNEAQRQTIKNRKVCEQLESRGDSLDQPREIDHWIYFRGPIQREQFRVRSEEIGFRTRGITDAPSREAAYGIQVYRVDLPSYNAIDDVTFPLFRLAQEFGGEYDGWETVVLKTR